MLPKVRAALLHKLKIVELEEHFIRAVANLTVRGGQEFHFSHSVLKFRSIFKIFPQTFLIFFLILALRMGDSPTGKGPGYTTAFHTHDTGFDWSAANALHFEAEWLH